MNKRNRNRTIDFSSLPNNADYYQVTATCTTKTFQTPPKIEISTESGTAKPEKIQTQSSTETDTSEQGSIDQVYTKD